MIEAALVALLEQDAAVAAIVGDRIYPSIIPQRVASPALAYWRVSTVRQQLFDHPAADAAVRYQIDAQADSYPVARELAGALRRALNGYRGTLDGEHIHHLVLAGEQDIYDTETGAHRVALDIIVTHDEEQ